MKRRKDFAKESIKEFEEKGFIKSFSNRHLLDLLRERYNFKIFDAGFRISAGRLTKYGAYEMFGDKITYYYDKRRENEFVDFLVDKFYTQNPDASSDLKSSFTRLLHVHGLCWAGCVFHNTAINVRKFKEDMAKKRYKNR